MGALVPSPHQAPSYLASLPGPGGLRPLGWGRANLPCGAPCCGHPDTAVPSPIAPPSLQPGRAGLTSRGEWRAEWKLSKLGGSGSGEAAVMGGRAHVSSRHCTFPELQTKHSHHERGQSWLGSWALPRLYSSPPRIPLTLNGSKGLWSQNQLAHSSSTPGKPLITPHRASAKWLGSGSPALAGPLLHSASRILSPGPSKTQPLGDRRVRARVHR